ncbi:hypothetical protein AJ79_04133 [Helicocarpus griseus UAMH5409]|uniref:N-acetyltransferase domain-containing protein n=1 Tax=Helicocarpus griseus UAMH5409 TaxID=1447875 RepID=A0A2B7XUL1_9EURO|nr:hypothetical protein AJ79_04133 [Helicocarpus griseus UAMH5409]
MPFEDEQNPRMEILPYQPVYVDLSSSIPSIKGNRLFLRPVTDSDVAALFAIRSRPEVAKSKSAIFLSTPSRNPDQEFCRENRLQKLTNYMPGSYPPTPFKSIEETREWMASKIFSQGPPDIIGRNFNLAVILLSSTIDESQKQQEKQQQQQLIGYVSINTLYPCPEIGYSFLPEYWGTGYATEALQLMLKLWWGFPRRSVERGAADSWGGNVEKVYAVCKKTNVASYRVLEKCGFEIVKELCYDGVDILVWGVERSGL